MSFIWQSVSSCSVYRSSSAEFRPQLENVSRPLASPGAPCYLALRPFPSRSVRWDLTMLVGPSLKPIWTTQVCEEGGIVLQYGRTTHHSHNSPNCGTLPYDCHRPRTSPVHSNILKMLCSVKQFPCPKFLVDVTNARNVG